MKNFFQRKQDGPQPIRSNTPTNAYKVWLPPPEASARASGPNWVPTNGLGPGSRGGAESYHPNASTSATYKYASGNNTGYYYANGPTQAAPAQPFPPPQYYPDRPDSRLGYAAYPYQYPQPNAAPTTSNNRREGKSRASEPAASTDKAPRVPRPSLSSSIKEGETKKPKHKARDTSMTGKRRDSRVDADKESRKESKRDVRSRLLAEEGDSSDSSMQRPPSSASHVRRRLEEGRMMRPQQDSTTFQTTGPRVGFPVQPTAASSSSGKQTPQISRMPVHLPATKSQRPDEPSESDTDRGTLHNARQFLRRNSLTQRFQRPPDPAVDKKAKESRGLWPFSRSKSSQVVPQSAGKVSAKTRADSTPSRYPPPVNDFSTKRPESRRNASDSALSDNSRQIPAPQEPLARPIADIQSRSFFFATQANDPSSRPATAPQPGAPTPLQNRSSSNDSPPIPGIQSSKYPPPTDPQNSRPRAMASDIRFPQATGPSFQPVSTASQQAAIRSRSSSNDPPNPTIWPSEPSSAMPSTYRPAALPATNTVNGPPLGGFSGVSYQNEVSYSRPVAAASQPAPPPLHGRSSSNDRPSNLGIPPSNYPLNPLPAAGTVNGPSFGVFDEDTHQSDRTPAPQDSRPGAMGLDMSANGFRAADLSSRPVTTASEQAAIHALRSRPPNNAPNPTIQSSEHRLPANVPSSTLTERPETPSRRNVQSTLPPIYASTASNRPPDRSAPKVSQLVAGFEARSSDAPTQPMARPIARREPSVSQLYAPPEQSDRASAGPSAATQVAKQSTRREPSLSQLRQPSQGSGTTASSAHRPPPATHSYAGASQPTALSKSHPTADAPSRPVVDGINPQASNQPDVLKTQLRDLLSDTPNPSRSDGKTQTRNLSETRQHAAQPSAPIPSKPSPQPPDLNPAAQLYPPAQSPIQVYSAVTSSMAYKHAKAGGEPSMVWNPPPPSSSRRPDISHSESDRMSHGGASRVDERDGDRTHGRSSRSKKDHTAVMKTPSKDSSRYTSSPSPVLNAQSTSQLQSQSAGGGRTIPNNPSASSPLRDRTPAGGKSHSSRTPSSPRPAASSSAQNNYPSNVATARPPSRSAGPASGTEPPLLFSQPSSRPSGVSAPTSNSRSAPRVPSQESILKTPSSLAPSVLPHSASRTSLQASVSSENRRKGILGIFRSKAEQQAQGPVPPATHPDRGYHSAAESARERKSRRKQTTPTLESPPTTRPDRIPPSSSGPVEEHKPRHRSKAPPPITIPDPSTPVRTDRKSPNTRVFTPFRYLSIKKKRVSTASMDAVDGTAFMGSPTASMQSTQMMPTQSPPRRDVRIATQDWRNREESEAMAHGKLRRKRPGVVFDVEENPLEEVRMRPARARKAKGPVEPNDSSDAS